MWFSPNQCLSALLPLTDEAIVQRAKSHLVTCEPGFGVSALKECLARLCEVRGFEPNLGFKVWGINPGSGPGRWTDPSHTGSHSEL